MTMYNVAASFGENHGTHYPPEALGNSAFKENYNVKYAYVTGAMYKGIASTELVIAMARAKLLSFFGAGGLTQQELEKSITNIKSALTNNETFGINLLPDYINPEKELRRVELLLEHNIRCIEAAAYVELTPAIVLFRLRGIHIAPSGQLQAKNSILAKVSHPDIAALFMQPPPEKVVRDLLQNGLISAEQAAMAKHIPLAQDICVEADSGGHTDRGNANVLLPAIQYLRQKIQQKHNYKEPLRVGLAGGIGVPETVMAAFVLGADFVMTGSINQCTVEAGTSDVVKDLLQSMNINDTDYAPAGDMFESGAIVQVLKKGLFFPSRANKLYRIYIQYESLDDIPSDLIHQLEKNIFQCSVSDIWQQTRTYLQKSRPALLTKIENNPRKKMAAVFRWYFRYTTNLSLQGEESQKVNFQIHTSPALGALNQLLAGTPKQSWRSRHVVWIAEYLMSNAACLLYERLLSYFPALNKTTPY